MIKGKRVALRPIREGDWSLLETWGQDKDLLRSEWKRDNQEIGPA